MIVVSDTSPICYLLLIGEIELLPQLYGQVIIPRIVQKELSDERSPIAVKNWIKNPPKWLIIQDVTISADKDLDIINAGEKAAIALALQKGANLIIIDEVLGRKVARNKGLKVTGLLGILDRAAQQNIVDFPKTIAALKKTTFRASSKLIESLLSQY
jgi:predicted nucleic acid-binding protein